MSAPCPSNKVDWDAHWEDIRLKELSWWRQKEYQSDMIKGAIEAGLTDFADMVSNRPPTIPADVQRYWNWPDN